MSEARWGDLPEARQLARLGKKLSRAARDAFSAAARAEMGRPSFFSAFDPFPHDDFHIGENFFVVFPSAAQEVSRSGRSLDRTGTPKRQGRKRHEKSTGLKTRHYRPELPPARY
jgi:hypothetical protein